MANCLPVTYVLHKETSNGDTRAFTALENILFLSGRTALSSVFLLAAVLSSETPFCVAFASSFGALLPAADAAGAAGFAAAGFAAAGRL